MTARLLTFATLAICLALTLAACGGSGSGSSASTTTSTAPPATTPPAASTPKPHGPAAASKTAAERRAAGRAAPFVEPEADNSVPTFGAEASASERGEAEASLQAYLRARAAADWASACRLLAAPTREGFEKLARSSTKAKGGCPAVLGAFSKGTELSDPLTAGLLSLRVHGANAFALFYGPGHQRYMVPMNREGDSWRPTQAAPIAYPPGAPAAAAP